MTVASTGKAPRTTGSAENEVLPLDVETISYSAEAALSMKMATSTREEIDGAAPADHRAPQPAARGGPGRRRG